MCVLYAHRKGLSHSSFIKLTIVSFHCAKHELIRAVDVGFFMGAESSSDVGFFIANGGVHSATPKEMLAGEAFSRSYMTN